MHALNYRQITGAGRSDFVLDFVDGFCVTLEKMRRSGGVDGCRIRHQPAHTKAVDERKFFNVLAGQLCQLQQNTLAVRGVGPRPNTCFECFAPAATARFTSSRSQAPTLVKTASVAGLIVSNVSPEAASTILSSMKA